jgi:hypothetical protein
MGMDEPTRPLWLSDPAGAASSDSFSCKKGGIGPPFRLSGGLPLWEYTPYPLAEEIAGCKPIPSAPCGLGQDHQFFLSPLVSWVRLPNFSLPTGADNNPHIRPWCWTRVRVRESQDHQFFPSPLVGEGQGGGEKGTCLVVWWFRLDRVANGMARPHEKPDCDGLLEKNLTAWNVLSMV